MTQPPLFDLSEFETFEGAGRRRNDPAIAIQARGAISFNAAAFDQIGRPEQVALMYNARRGQIAIKATQSGNAGAVNTRPSGKGQGAMVSARAFLDAYRIPFEEYRGLTVLAIKEGLAVVQLPDGYGERE